MLPPSSQLQRYGSSNPSEPVKFPLDAIVYSEFDNEVGPKIVCQEPPGYLPQEEFEAISNFFFTSKDLCHKVITLAAFQHRFMGYSICLVDDKYGRSTLFFNICFVFAASADLSAYQPILSKLGTILESLELEAEFLYKAKSRSKIPSLMTRIFNSLSAEGECSVVANQANKINLKLFPKMEPPSLVQDYQVPVRIKDLDTLVKSSWDITIQRILPWVDGINYVKRISTLSGVDTGLVKESLRQLMYYGCVKIKDIFTYNNVYVPCRNIDRLATDRKLQRDCLEAISASPDLPWPPLADVLRLYCSLGRGARVGNFCIKHRLHERNIDFHRFFSFGVINDFLRRVRKYPIERLQAPAIIRLNRDGRGSGNKNYQAQSAEIDVEAGAEKLALCSQDNNLTELVLNLFGQRPESNGNGPGPQSQAGQPADKMQ